MALTSTEPDGLRPIGPKLSGNEIILLPGDPGVTFNVGDRVTVAAGEGVAKLAADSGASIGSVVKKIVCPANTTAFPQPGAYLNHAQGSEADKTLIPVRLDTAGGLQVQIGKFANHKDETVVSYSAANRYAAMTTGMTADDYPNGALVYVYEGTGAGQWNVVEDYDHADGTVELMLVFHRPFAIDLDNTSKIIVLSGEGASNKGIYPMGRIDLDDEDALDCSDGADNGTFAVLCDWRNLGHYLSKLLLPVVPAARIYG